MYSWFNPPATWLIGAEDFYQELALLSPVVGLSLGRRDVADGLQ